MEEFKTIKIELDFADENGNRSRKIQTIKVNTPSLKDKSKPNYFNNVKSIYTLSFTVQIPEHIHSYLIGKNIPSSRSENTRTYESDFSKSINRTSIEQLTEKYCEVVDDYVLLKEIKKANLKKVIFYQFDNKYGNSKSTWNAISFGKFVNLKYKYFIGYISEIRDRVNRYNSDKLLISSTYDKEIYNFKYVEWSEERELFFKNVQNSFESITDKINDFEKNINEESINQIISTNPKLLN